MYSRITKLSIMIIGLVSFIVVVGVFSKVICDSKQFSILFLPPVPELEDVEEAGCLPYHNPIFIIKVISSINISCKNQYPDAA